MRALLLLLLVGSASAAWLGEEYWSTVSYSGRLIQGRSVSDFVQMDDDIRGRYIAYWSTRSRYPNEHFESFGYAYVRADGRICGWFAGMNFEAVEVCGGFRVLSYPVNNRNAKQLFEWIPSGRADMQSTAGYHAHRIAKFQHTSANATYGDAKPRERTFTGVLPPNADVIKQSGYDYQANVQVLRLLAAEVGPDRTGRIDGTERYQPDTYAPGYYHHHQRYPVQPSPTQARPVYNYNYYQTQARPVVYYPPTQAAATRDLEDVTMLFSKNLVRDQFNNLFERVVRNGREELIPYRGPVGRIQHRRAFAARTYKALSDASLRRNKQPVSEEAEDAFERKSIVQPPAPVAAVAREELVANKQADSTEEQQQQRRFRPKPATHRRRLFGSDSDEE